MGFDYPWVFLLLLAVLPLVWVLRRSELLTRRIVHLFRSVPPPLRYFRSRSVLAVSFTASLLTAGAGPYLEPTRTADYLFLVDTSRSMQARESCAEPTFLDRAKNVMQDVIEKIPEARFGIVAFDRLAFPVSQLTYSHAYLDSVINNGLFIGMTYRATDTELFNALKVIAAKKRALPDLYENVENVILLSDGHLDDEEWRQNLEQPLQDLLGAGITLLVVGVGNPAETPIPMTDQAGVCEDKLTEVNGTVVRIPLRSDILQAVATGTHGHYFEERQTGELVDYLKEQTNTEVTANLRFGEDQRKNIGWVLLVPAAAALFGLFLL